MQINKVTDNIIVASFLDRTRSKYNDAPQTINVTCIALPDELVFVDCGVYTKAIAKFREEMEERFQRKTSHLLLTHNHWDHIIAMAAFKDVDIVITKKGIPSLKDAYKGYLSQKERVIRAEKYRTEDAEIAENIETADLFLPNITVKEELIIGSGENKIIFRIVGNHSTDSAIVHIPSEKTLCAGDNLLVCYPQLIFPSFKVVEMYKEWEKMDIDNFIPGHGQTVKKNYVKNVRLYYENLNAFLKEQIAKKMKLEDILVNPDLPQYFAIDTKDWSYACRPEANWLEDDIYNWYNFLSKKQK